VSPSHRPSTGSCHRARSGSTARPDQWLPPCMHPRGARRQKAALGAPALSTRARYELGLSPLSLSTITTLSGSHVIAGAAVAMSSLGSALAIAMMVGGGVGRPPWPRGLVQTGSAHRVGHRLIRLGASCHFSGRRAHTLPYRALSSHAGKCCACDETADQGQPWPPRAEPWHRASVSATRHLAAF
jgi:hypothetical protein